MSKIGDVNQTAVDVLRGRITEGVKGCTVLEEAAQKLTEVMYKEFSDSIVLVRLFATIPFGELPASNQAFVTKLAASQGIQQLVNDPMLVLSLLGTYGVEANWRSRHKSQGHVGIPLASVDFIDRIPMMSRLLKELGLDLDWIKSKDTDIIAKTLGKMAGVFYVPDAKTAVDQQGRRIIAAQDFVKAYGVETVFGLGGSYITPTGGYFLTVIVFTRDKLQKRQAEVFMPLMNYFKTDTATLASARKVFA